MGRGPDGQFGGRVLVLVVQCPPNSLAREQSLYLVVDGVPHVVGNPGVRHRADGREDHIVHGGVAGFTPELEA